jgi:hypothetical protein
MRKSRIQIRASTRWETRLDVPVSLHCDETGATAVNPLGELH